MFPLAILSCVATSVRPKPRSNFGISIGAETFFSETETFFFNLFKILPCFPASWEIKFLKS